MENTASSGNSDGKGGLVVGAALVSGVGIAAAASAWRRRRL
jgi:hypothetical protein